jgi:hypothetical protein
MPFGPVLDRINALAWVGFLAAAAGWLGANELRWSPVEGAADYAVRVTDTRGQVRFQDTVKGTQSHSLPPTVQRGSAWGGNRSDLACRLLAGCLEMLSLPWPSKGGYKAGEGCSVSGGGGDGGVDGNGGAGLLPRISAKPRMRCSLGSGPRLHRLSK